MLLSLPSELLLSILKHLPVSDIATCLSTCKTLKTIIDQHESTVYRQAAAHPSLHLIPHDQIQFSDVASLGWHSKRFLGEANNWKDLCRRACDIRSGWLGKGPSRITSYDCGLPGDPDVHRFKVDEKRGFFITTHTTGGLAVIDIDTGALIWGLQRDYVHFYAHCEYGEGFLVFDRSPFSHGQGNFAKEVWRLVSDDPRISSPGEFEVVPESGPDDAQLNPAQVYLSGGRLKFVPHALLRPPGDVLSSAFRFVYPTLLVAGGDRLFFWDVRTGRLVEHMTGVQRQMPNVGNTSRGSTGNVRGRGTHASAARLGRPRYLNEAELGHVRYVEVNDKYAFVCGTGAFKVFRRRAADAGANWSSSMTERREPKTADCILALTESRLSRRGMWYFRVGYVKPEDLSKGSKNRRKNRNRNTIDSMWKNRDRVIVRHDTVLSKATHTSPLPDTQSQNCPAVHVSSCGQHLIVLMDDSRLLIIPYFERVIGGSVKDVYDIAIDIQLNAPAESIYLAYGDGRVGVVTELAVFIIYPIFAAPDDFVTPPQLQVQRIPMLNNLAFLTGVSCLQMSSTALWLTWGKNLFPYTAGKESRVYEEMFRGTFDGKSAQFAMSAEEPQASFVTSVDFGVKSSNSLTRCIRPTAR